VLLRRVVETGGLAELGHGLGGPSVVLVVEALDRTTLSGHGDPRLRPR